MTEFDRFWARFPRRVGKLAAMKAYQQARMLATAEEILAGVDNYIRHKPAYADYCHPRTFLSQGRWMDEYDDPRQSVNTSEAEAFGRHFCQLFSKHRQGARYHYIPTKHTPILVSLLETYGRERLEKLAVVMLTATADEWINGTDRGIEVLQAKVNWLEAKLAEYEQQHGVIRVA
jgi:hypothetical protein